MAGNDMRGAYYAVVPAEVRYDPDLKPNAKLLYGELTALCNDKGYCWATNEYFAELYGLSAGTISRLISQLEKKGYIRCEMAATASGSERRIYAGMFLVQPRGGIDENDNTPPGGLDEKRKGGLDENVKQNNTSINNTPYSPPQGDSAPLSRPKRTRRAPKDAPDWAPERFAGFWKAYPRGENKQAAIRAWDKLKPSDELIDKMAAALKRQLQRRDWQEGIGIPHASTWLNNRRWEDEDRGSIPAAPANAPPAQPLRGEGVRYL